MQVTVVDPTVKAVPLPGSQLTATVASHKAGARDPEAISAHLLHAELTALGRVPGSGPGTSPRRTHSVRAEERRPTR